MPSLSSLFSTALLWSSATLSGASTNCPAGKSAILNGIPDQTITSNILDQLIPLFKYTDISNQCKQPLKLPISFPETLLKVEEIVITKCGEEKFQYGANARIVSTLPEALTSDHLTTLQGIWSEYKECEETTSSPTLNPTSNPTPSPTALIFIPTNYPTKRITSGPTKVPTKFPTTISARNTKCMRIAETGANSCASPDQIVDIAKFCQNHAEEVAGSEEVSLDCQRWEIVLEDGTTKYVDLEFKPNATDSKAGSTTIVPKEQSDENIWKTGAFLILAVGGSAATFYCLCRLYAKKAKIRNEQKENFDIARHGIIKERLRINDAFESATDADLDNAATSVEEVFINQGSRSNNLNDFLKKITFDFTTQTFTFNNKCFSLSQENQC